MVLRFDKKVALITGAGVGLGRSYALLLASRGAFVVVNDLGSSKSGEGKSVKEADTVVADIKKAGGNAVANYDSVEFGKKIIDFVIRTFGRIDIIINNAGILRDKSYTNMTQKDWDLVYNVHVLGVHRIIHAAWPFMRKQEYGRIINVASSSGLFGNFGQANYSMAKLGILGLTKTLSKEGFNKNIYVNCIAPIAASRMTSNVLPDDLKEILCPEYVAPVVGYLAHDSCKVTGQIYEIGGGWVSALRWQRSKGSLLPLNNPTIESVQENWEQVNNYNNDAEYPESIQDSFSSILNLRDKEKAKNFLSKI